MDVCKNLTPTGLLDRVLADNAKYMKRRKDKNKSYPNDQDPVFTQMYRYAEPLDIFLMVLGSLVAVVNGAILPVTAFLFGDLTNAFLAQRRYVHDPRYHMDNYTHLALFTGFSFEKSKTINTSLPKAFITEGEFLNVTSRFGMDYIYLGLIAFVLTFIQNSCWEIACCNQVFKLRQVFFAQAMRQDLSWYDERENEDLSNKITDDMERMRDGLGSKVPLLFHAISLMCTGLAVGCITSWKLTLVIMIGSPILIISSAVTAKVSSGVAEREQLRYGIAGGVANEVLTSINTVCAFGEEQREIDRFSRAVIKGKKETMKKYYYLSGGMAISIGIIYFLDAVGLWFGAKLFLDQEILPGQIFTIFLSVLSGALTIGNSLPNFVEISSAIGCAATVFEIIDNLPKIDPYSKEGQIVQNIKGDIEFQNVYFFYPTRRQVMVLCDLSIKIPAGKVIAVVGASGSGKSTLVNLILRFYDPLGGKVLIDNNDVAGLNIHGYRSHIGVVSQEPILFDVTIEENIRYGNPQATKLEIEEAAKTAFAHTFIETLPKGYQTLVGERGTQLSGGEKQRIALARAIVRKPKILLLDEATSALDAQSEMIVQAALENASRGRTTLIIAHRLSTVRNADLIYTLKGGKVAECGKHEELMEKKGVYYNLLLAQNQKTSEPECPERTVIPLKIDDSIPKNRFDLTKLSFKRLSSRKYTTKEDEKLEVSFFELLKLTDSPWLIGYSLFACIAAGFHVPVFATLYGGILGLFSLPKSEFWTAIILWCSLFIVLAFFTALALGTATLATSVVTENMVKELRIKTFKNILSQQISFFDDVKYSPIKLINALAKEPPLVKNIAGMRAGSIIITCVTTFLSLLISFYSGWRIALIVLCFVPMLVFGNWIQMKLRLLSFVKECEATAKVVKVASECLQNIKTVQFLGLQEYMLTVFTNELQNSHRDERKQGFIFALSFAMVNATVYFMYGCTFKFGSEFVDNDYMSGSDIYRTVFALVLASTNIGSSALFFQDFGKSKVAITRVYKLMKMPSSLNVFSNEGEKPVIEGDVEFKDIYFSYPARKHVQVLQGFSLEIPKGKTVALVGGSGCGKSTLIALLERFYNPRKGDIYIDGVNIKKINLTYLRSKIGLVTQEPTLFDCTIRENICYGTTNLGKIITEQDVIQAAKSANIHDFIINLPEGYDTKVGERGSKLSGGQKQRIAIARALLRNPKILLLDEATSALDTESEKVVQDALDKAREGRTSIVIAHRLSTVQNADLIAVIADGRVVEIGTHQQLIGRKAHYYDLAKNQ